ncbi:MAG: hypothetical protein ABW154_10900 [Dyella sp.]
MSIVKQLAQVRAAQLEAVVAREQVAASAAALLARGHAYPLTSMGIAAGAGVAMGSLDVHPLRIPGLATLLSAGVSDAVAQAISLVAGLNPEHSDTA